MMKRLSKGLLIGFLTVVLSMFWALGCSKLGAETEQGDDKALAAVPQSSISASLQGTRLTVEWGAVRSATSYLVVADDTSLTVYAPATSAVFTDFEYVSGSVSIVIVAQAAGYSSSVTSYSFTPSVQPPQPQPQTLATPTGLVVDDGKLMWNTVTNATGYTVSDGVKTVTVYTNTVDLASSGFTIPTSGSVTYTVVAKAAGYYDSTAAAYTYTATVNPPQPQPQTLAKPTGLAIADGKLTWTVVANATSYTVSDGVKTVTVYTNTVDLAANGFTIPSGGSVVYTVIAKAAGYNDSPATVYNHTFEHTHTFNTSLWESNRTHHWNPITCGHTLTPENSKGYGAHEFNGNVCSVCSYERSEQQSGYVLFGEYPQTLKAANVTVSGSADGDGYYTGSDGARYAKVTATPYVMYPGFKVKYSNGDTVTADTVYYFKVEPIKWRVLEQSGGNSLIFCDSIIASGAYYKDEDNRSIGGSTVYPSNYMHSDIRDWLNGTFYSSAFSATQRQSIQTTTVDNSAATTDYSLNTYACENTQDKVFLLSNRDVYDTSYGFISDGTESDAARKLIVSDYARATGAFTSDSIVYAGCGWWWLRSPVHDSAIHADCGTASGMVGSSKVKGTEGGIAPAMWVSSSALTNA
ncbi:MAG: hypothetical protein K2M48_04870 [Clostridiales bacterium]|nr:hypothetical protein [Clostridiales bacterium]